MAANLVLKNGMFIDEAPAAAADGRVRSSSLPAAKVSQNELFSFEEEYVSTLSAMWNTGTLPVMGAVRAKAAQERAPREVGVDCDEAFSQVGVGRCAGFDTRQRQRQRQHKNSSAALAEEWPSHASSAGSVGHPLFCCKPCSFFLSGLCEHGSSCGFCHDHHAASTLKVDSQNKVLLKQLCGSEREALLAEIVRQKLLQVDSAGSRLAREWRAAMGDTELEGGLPQLELPGVRSSSFKKLLRNLRRVNLHTVCALARTTCEGSLLARATQTLLDSLREAERAGTLRAPGI